MTTLGDPASGGPYPTGPAGYPVPGGAGLAVPDAPPPAPPEAQPPAPPEAQPPAPPEAQPPAPPRGPGVIPPFPAPPVEGRGRRVGLGLGLGAAVLVLVLGGGVAAAVGLTTVATNALNEQADVVVGDYLDAIRDRRYGAAYDMLCQQTRDTRSEAEFTREVSAEEPIASYDVGRFDMVQLSAPVDVTYVDGSTGRLRAYLAQNRRTGGFEVCRIEE